MISKSNGASLYQRAVTIANGASRTEAISLDALGDIRCLGVSIPSAWTAADLALLGCDTEGGTYEPLKKADGSRIKIASITADAVGGYIFPVEAWLAAQGYAYIKLESVDTADGTAEAQGAARALIVRLLR